MHRLFPRRYFFLCSKQARSQGVCEGCARTHRRTGTTELGGAAPVCPKKIFFARILGLLCPKNFPTWGGQKPCLPEHFARKSFTYYINFGSFARKIFFWGGCRPPRPLGSYAYARTPPQTAEVHFSVKKGGPGRTHPPPRRTAEVHFFLIAPPPPP